MASEWPIYCWELLGPHDPYLPAVRRLYEATQAPGERIPWEWLERSVARRRRWRPGAWSGHLLVAANDPDDSAPVGFAYGAHVPDYGGYVCYLGVDPAARGRGVGTRLFRQFYDLFQVDAGSYGEPLPFVIWESHAPGPDATDAEQALWAARLRLFSRVGAYWIEGVTLQSPNYHDDGPPVPLQLFLAPRQTPAEAFDSFTLREVVDGLMRHVYRFDRDDPLYRQSLPAACSPRLQPVQEAERLP
jgi:ribosomal protein S18 acetylase RimI-like enzyme